MMAIFSFISGLLGPVVKLINSIRKDKKHNRKVDEREEIHEDTTEGRGTSSRNAFNKWLRRPPEDK